MNRLIAGKTQLRTLLVGLALVLLAGDALAHGERAQLASMRMRTVHWFDTKVEPQNVKVGDIVTVTGKLVTSVWWPKHMPSIAETVYLNIGVPGPTFLRLHSEVNGVPMMRSTAFPLGKVYEYKTVLRARIAGRYHVHPILNVKDAGSLVDKGTWLEVAENDSAAPFVNEVTTLPGDTINLETYGLKGVFTWHLIWIAMGIAYLLYWLIRKELFIPRFIRVRELGQDRANELMTKKDFVVSSLFFTGTLALILGGYFWAEHKYPITIPLQTGLVDVEPIDIPTGGLVVDVDHATYDLAGRSLSMQFTMTNNSDSPLRIAEFLTANIRFLNPEINEGEIYEGEEMVSKDGLTASVDIIQPGQTVEVELVASDALWEQYRMTGLIHDPDSRFAGMIFYYDENGERFFQEVGGAVLPNFF
ncbi:MAG: methane monooxygenase/ammonia monooxygenase subunit B [Gammaproteobacteria bacterium]|nr:methane monooxygenase/ammonia monooxygenase subunit B [Gammaproteobacteria bacterium]MBQ0839651.1 methane monooxygenase/ammonia monooxygenase subunit B [Gammaproteobacteria bacterium]